MTGENKNIISNLVLISKRDASLTRIAAEKKRLEKDLKDLRAQLKTAEGEREQKTRKLDDKKYKYQKEEHALRDESEKLVARRKSLTSLNNYKLQQAAEKEIEHASRQITLREEALLGVLGEVDVTEKECASLETLLSSIKEKYSKLESEAKDAFSALEDEEAKFLAEREELRKLLEPGVLSTYERVRERHPTDPVVAIKNLTCPGCFMQVVPQIVVQISRGDLLVKCRGCARILYLEEQEQTT